MRGDGLHGIEPDKIGELGVGYEKFHQITGEAKYLEAALHLADALAAHVRDVADRTTTSPGRSASFAVAVSRQRAHRRRDRRLLCNVIEPIRLFDELLRRPDRLALTARQVAAYQRARKLAWDWLVSKNGPLVTYVWNGYFEDVPSDPQLANRVQITPLETARYILKREPRDLDVTRQAEALTTWVRAVFGEPGEPSINEQSWCRVPMGSHTARYASVEALFFERTGDPRFKEEAYRHFNWATYPPSQTASFPWARAGPAHGGPTVMAITSGISSKDLPRCPNGPRRMKIISSGHRRSWSRSTMTTMRFRIAR